MKSVKAVLAALLFLVWLVSSAVPVIAAGAEQEWITVTQIGSVRSDAATGGLNGFVGMKITAKETIYVTQLGRYVLNGNQQLHEVRLYDISEKKVVCSSLKPASPMI